jgi:predicted transcriptional regulator
MQPKNTGFRVLILDETTPQARLEKVMKALDSLNRVRILGFLAAKTASVSEISTALELAISTTAAHIEILEDAGLIKTEVGFASRGLSKNCTRMFDKIEFEFPVEERPREKIIESMMPIGNYVDCRVSPTCGLLNQTGIIGLLDDPASFYEPEHVNAQMIWFRQGYLEYRFPNRLAPNMIPTALRLSMEICSEAPHHNLNWPSDITLWINGVEVGSWTSPSDFGGEPGRLTPEWWPTRNTQYGLLKVWHVNTQVSEIDGMRISGVTINDLKLGESSFISVRIGVKSDAENIGGINFFGSHFGNYPQDLVLSINYNTVSWTSDEQDKPALHAGKD